MDSNGRGRVALWLLRNRRSCVWQGYTHWAIIGYHRRRHRVCYGAPSTRGENYVGVEQ